MACPRSRRACFLATARSNSANPALTAWLRSIGISSLRNNDRCRARIIPPRPLSRHGRDPLGIPAVGGFYQNRGLAQSPDERVAPGKRGPFPPQPLGKTGCLPVIPYRCAPRAASPPRGTRDRLRDF